MIGYLFQDGSMIVAAVPDVIDLVGSATGPLGYRLVRRWFALMDRGHCKRPRWLTARIESHPCDIEGHGVITNRYHPPSSYVEPHLFTHEVEAYEDLLARANIAPSLN